MSHPATLVPENLPDSPKQSDLPFQVDRALRAPTLIFFISAIGWLLLASLLWTLASAQQVAPHAWWTGYGVPWLSFGRVYTAASNLLVYGWSSMAGIAAAVWILGRLSHSPVRAGLLPVFAAFIWDFSLLCGLLSLLSGGSRGHVLVDINPYAGFGLFFALVILSIWVIGLFWNRRTTYVAHWYLLAAFFWFAWAYLVANVLLNVIGTPGPAQAALHWWYVNVVRDLWLTPLALGVAFYLLPKLLGRPLFSYRLAFYGFGGLAILGGWTGMTNILGGPLPAWMMTASVVATVLMTLPIAAVAANFHYTLREDFEALSWNLVLRFVVVGAMLYTVVGVWEALNSFRTVSRLTEGTMAVSLTTPLTIFGFVGLILFGALYYIVPRLIDRNWVSTLAIKLHFWLTVVGLGLLTFTLIMGGLIQGIGLNDSKITFAAVTDLTKPFLLFQFGSVLVLLAANVIAAWSFVTIFLGPKAGGIPSLPALAPTPASAAPQEVPVT
jgi:cytochrome c oxidase cbb3-type subunit 1